MKGKERLHQEAIPVTCSAAAVLNSPRSLCSALGSEKKDGGSFFQEAVRHWASELGSRVKQMVWLTAPQRNRYWTYKCHSILLSLTFSGTSVQGLAHYRQTTHINVHQKIKKRSLSWKQETAAQKMKAQELEGKEQCNRKSQAWVKPPRLRRQDPPATAVLQVSSHPEVLSKPFTALSCSYLQLLPTYDQSQSWLKRQTECHFYSLDRWQEVF